MHVFRCSALLALCFLLPRPALAYVRTMSTSGRPLAWSNPSIAIYANPRNASGLSAAQVSTLLGNAYAGWQVAGSRVGFSYSQSTSNPLGSSLDGRNAAYFSSAAGANLDWGIVALTEVLYNVSSGQIQEADTVFNDQQFLFTANPGDTGSSSSGRSTIFLTDVATHEAGHLLGLDHSLVNLSSLIYTAFSGQFSLSPDEKNAMLTIYPNGSVNGGALSGIVAGKAGGIFGAHVVAVNLLTGQVEAGALATSDGSFRVGDVSRGKYAVMMEPFGNQVSSVSPYYENTNHRFCNGSLFRRRFYSTCDSNGAVSVMDVGSGANVGLGTLAPSCDAMGNAGAAPTSVGAAKELPNGGGAAWGTLNPGDTHYYIVRGVSGALSARALSFSLFSPADVQVDITDLSGNRISGSTSVDNVANPGPGGVTNYDSQASANVPTGDYLVRVRSASQSVSRARFSDGYELADENGHYLISLSVNGDIAATSTSDMSACVSVPNARQNASFRDTPDTSTQPKTAGCGTIQGGGPFTGGMTQVLAVAGLLQMMALAARAKRRFLPALAPRRR